MFTRYLSTEHLNAWISNFNLVWVDEETLVPADGNLILTKRWKSSKQSEWINGKLDNFKLQFTNISQNDVALVLMLLFPSKYLFHISLMHA